MKDYKLTTVFNSTYPIDCHIIKGRLESENINCYVFDENIIYVHPFRSVAVGGVKLKVESRQVEKAESIIKNIKNHFLQDEFGEYKVNETFDNEFIRQNILLHFRKLIQENPKILENESEIRKTLTSEWFTENEIQEIILIEKKFHHDSKLIFKFNWKEFWYELLDWDRDFFKYIHIRSNKYYVEKDIFENFLKSEVEKNKTNNVLCPNCNSDNVKFGHAIDFKYDIIYFLLSFLIMSPFPPFRKKYHCFDCGHNFKK